MVDLTLLSKDGVEVFKKAQVLAPDITPSTFTVRPEPVTLQEAINIGQVFRAIATLCEPKGTCWDLEVGNRQYHFRSREGDHLETTMARNIEERAGVFEVLGPAVDGPTEPLACPWIPEDSPSESRSEPPPSTEVRISFALSYGWLARGFLRK